MSENLSSSPGIYKLNDSKTGFNTIIGSVIIVSDRIYAINGLSIPYEPNVLAFNQSLRALKIAENTYAKDQDYETVLRKEDVIDNLTLTETDKPLSANMGKVLDTTISELDTNLTSEIRNLTTQVEQSVEDLNMKIDVKLDSAPRDDVSLIDEEGIISEHYLPEPIKTVRRIRGDVEEEFRTGDVILELDNIVVPTTGSKIIQFGESVYNQDSNESIVEENPYLPTYSKGSKGWEFTDRNQFLEVDSTLTEPYIHNYPTIINSSDTYRNAIDKLQTQAIYSNCSIDNTNPYYTASSTIQLISLLVYNVDNIEWTSRVILDSNSGNSNLYTTITPLSYYNRYPSYISILYKFTLENNSKSVLIVEPELLLTNSFSIPVDSTNSVLRMNFVKYRGDTTIGYKLVSYFQNTIG